MTEANPSSVMQYICEGYRRYYDSAFWMRDPAVMAERRAILDMDGVMSREPLIEAVPQYPSIVPIEEACKRAGLDPFVAKHLGDVVFGTTDAVRLRLHQAQSLEIAIGGSKDGHRNVVVTSGTGSGKTESFLLPLIASLMQERLAGPGTGILNRWWQKGISKDEKQWRTNACHACTRALPHQRSGRRPNLTPPTSGRTRLPVVRHAAFFLWSIHRRDARLQLYSTDTAQGKRSRQSQRRRPPNFGSRTRSRANQETDGC